MNGYQMSADAYRDYLAKKNPPGEARADIERKIRYLFDTVTAEQAERYYIEH